MEVLLGSARPPAWVKAAVDVTGTRAYGVRAAAVRAAARNHTVDNRTDLTGPASPYAGLGASSLATHWSLLGIFTVVTGFGAYAVVCYRAGRRQR